MSVHVCVSGSVCEWCVCAPVCELVCVCICVCAPVCVYLCVCTSVSARVCISECVGVVWVSVWV